MKNRDLLPGVFFVLLGLLFAAITGAGGQLITVAIGVCFLAAYIHQRRYGYLVTGSILTGLGAGIALDPFLAGHGAT